MEIGKELGVGESEMAALRAASLLHDIGKIAVPEHILNKPGKLTREEFQKMKVHPVVGAEILERAHFPFPVAPIVRCHHEKWDGAGYPAGLKGEAIPIGARILAAVDCFDALASDRQYRRALPLDEAMAAVERESGRSFDPRVVEVLKRRYIDLEHMARSTHFDPFRLSTDIHIENGDAPAAGFASTGETDASASHAPTSGSASDWTRLESLLTRAHSSEPTLTMDETLGLFAARLAQNITFDDLAIYVRKSDVLQPAFVTGKHRPAIEPLRIPLGQGVTGWAAQASRSIINGNPAVEPGWIEAGTLLSALAIPLETSAGSVGVLTLYGAAENGFHSDDLKFLGRLTSALSSFVEGNTLAAGSSPSRVAASPALLSDRALQHV
jgi:putative nucleotidyltransferase with HDIG domain